eukprot:749383-Hanusia_phi.AAC.2
MGGGEGEGGGEGGGGVDMADGEEEEEGGEHGDMPSSLLRSTRLLGEVFRVSEVTEFHTMTRDSLNQGGRVLRIDSEYYSQASVEESVTEVTSVGLGGYSAIDSPQEGCLRTQCPGGNPILSPKKLSLFLSGTFPPMITHGHCVGH